MAALGAINTTTAVGTGTSGLDTPERCRLYRTGMSVDANTVTPVEFTTERYRSPAGMWAGPNLDRIVAVTPGLYVVDVWADATSSSAREVTLTFGFAVPRDPIVAAALHANEPATLSVEAVTTQATDYFALTYWHQTISATVNVEFTVRRVA